MYHPNLETQCLKIPIAAMHDHLFCSEDIFIVCFELFVALLIDSI